MSLVPTTEIISPLLKKQPPFSDRKETNSRVIGSHFQHPEDTLKFGPNGFTGKVMFVSLYIMQKVTHTQTKMNPLKRTCKTR